MKTDLFRHLPAVLACVLCVVFTDTLIHAGTSDGADYRRMIEAQSMTIEGDGYEVMANQYASLQRAVAYQSPEGHKVGQLVHKLERTLPAGEYLVWVLFYINDAGSRQGEPLQVRAALGGSQQVGEVARDGSASLNMRILVDAAEPFDTLTLSMLTPVNRVLIDKVYLSSVVDDFDLAVAQRNHLQIGTEQIRRKVESLKPTSDIEPDVVNMLANGRFDVGLPTFDWSTPYQSSYAITPEVWTSEDAAEGSFSLRIPMFRHQFRTQGDDPDQPTSLTLMHKPLPLEPNTTYHFRGMFRTDEGDPSVNLQVMIDPAFPDRDQPGLTVGRHRDAITQTWQAVSFSFETPDNTNGYYLNLVANAPSPATLWMDAMTLTREPVESHVPARPVEMGALWEAPGRVFYVEEPVDFSVLLHRYDAQHDAMRATVHVRVVDYFDNTVMEETFEASINEADTTVNMPLDLNVGRTGAFRLLIEGKVDGSFGAFDLPLQAYAFTVLHRPPDEMHGTLGAYITLAPQPIEIMSRAGIRSTTTLSCSNELLENWRYMEPVEGEIIWVDERVDHALAHDVKIIANLDMAQSVPSLPDWALDPEDESDRLYTDTVWGKRSFSRKAWMSFVERLTSHYQGRIDDWLIVDEPYHNMTPEEYTELLKATYEAAKRGNPDCRVIAHGGYYEFWLPAVEKLGAFDYMDGLSDYARNPVQAARLRGFAEKHDKFVLTVEYEWNASLYKHVDAPLTFWDRTVPWHQQPTQMSTVRALQSMSWAGAVGFNRYDARYPGGDMTQLDLYKSLFEYDGSLKPAAASYAVAAGLLDGFHGVGELELNDAFQSFLFEDERDFLLMLNTTPDRVLAIQNNFPDDVTVRDMMGNVVDSADVLLSRAAHYLTGPKGRLETVKATLAQSQPKQAVSITSERKTDTDTGQYYLDVTITNLLEDQPVEGMITVPSEILRAFWSKTWAFSQLAPGESVTLRVGLNLYEGEPIPEYRARVEYYINGSAANVSVPNIFADGMQAIVRGD